MNSNRRWSLWKHLLMSGGIFIIACLLFNSGPEAASIGIIGGADGPTAVFITGKVASHLKRAAITPLVIFIISMFLYKPVKRIVEKRG